MVIHVVSLPSTLQGRGDIFLRNSDGKGAGHLTHQNFNSLQDTGEGLF
jgi:hypothetical protein